ncbi:MAG TPA: hypothetical protein VFW00_10460, partial [Rhodocyclaceae bacterium]|nr:hypothetical protein [Rhodocyclaceae bacterium]
TNSSDTIERIVIHTALMALTDPATLGGKELARLRFYTERFGHLAQLKAKAPRPGDRAMGLFLLSSSSQGPKRFKAEHRLRSSETVLDCRPLLAQVQKHLSGLRQGTPPPKLGLPLEAKEPAYGFMLARCIEQWSEPRTRRDGRNKLQPRADLVAGFDSVRHFLATAAFQRRRSDSLEGVGKGLSVSSEWAIVDQSPSGFGLRHLSGNAGSITVGELVAMRPAESSSVYICVARRARSISTTELELGLETLCQQGVPASMNKTMPKGQQIAVPVLLMPKVAKLNGGPGLIAPIGDVKPGMFMVIPHKGKMVRLEAVSTVERLLSCELVQLKKETPE